MPIFLDKLSWESDARTVVLEHAGSLFSTRQPLAPFRGSSVCPWISTLTNHQLEASLAERRQRWLFVGWNSAPSLSCGPQLFSTMINLPETRPSASMGHMAVLSSVRPGQVVVFASRRLRDIRCRLISEEVGTSQPKELKSSASNGMTHLLASPPSMHRNVPF
jgi:hypothetical protein